MNINTFRPAYFVRRLRQISYQRRYPKMPWLTPGANLLLSEWLKPSDIGLEWGSGRSTVWFAKRLKHLTSVEHCSDWHKRVQQMLDAEGLSKKVDYRYIPIEIDEYAEPKDHPYVNITDEFPDQSLDFVLVDGWLRLVCMKKVLSKVKKGGLLALDNANRFLPNVFEMGNTTVHQPLTVPVPLPGLQCSQH